MNVFNGKLRRLKVNISTKEKSMSLNQRSIAVLKVLHSGYVLVPADKAANNVIVVCKKYYLEVVTRVIGYYHI